MPDRDPFLVGHRHDQSLGRVYNIDAAIQVEPALRKLVFEPGAMPASAVA